MSAEVPEHTDAVKLAKVIGQNARQLRRDADLTLDHVSIAAQMQGLNWSESRVADFESGRVAPNLATLIAVVLSLRDAGCAKATLDELVHSATPIQINDSLVLSNTEVVNLFGRPPAQERPSPEAVTAAINASREHRGAVRALIVAAKALGATEERTWKALGISRTELADLSARLWNRTFSEERDRRAGAGANVQKRGQVSRQLRKELQAAIEAATHGNDK